MHRTWQDTPRVCRNGGSPTTARLTSMTSCPFQSPQGAVLEGRDLPGGDQPAEVGWCGVRAVFRGGVHMPAPAVLRGTPWDPDVIQA